MKKVLISSIINGILMATVITLCDVELLSWQWWLLISYGVLAYSIGNIAGMMNRKEDNKTTSE